MGKRYVCMLASRNENTHNKDGHLCASLPAPPAWGISSSSKRSSKPVLRRPPSLSVRGLPSPAAAAPLPELELGFRPPRRPRGFLFSSSGEKIVRDFTVLCWRCVCFGGREQALSCTCRAVRTRKMALVEGGLPARSVS